MSATGVSSGYAIQMQTANGFRAITIGATADGGSADVLINSSAQILQSTGGQINANALSLVSAADVGSSSTPLLVNTSLLNQWPGARNRLDYRVERRRPVQQRHHDARTVQAALTQTAIKSSAIRSP
jgi:hypothetical protein